MKKSLFLILIFFLLPIGTWAGDGAACDTTDFEWCYQKYWVESVCKAPSSPWNANKGVGTVTRDYAPLEANEQNRKIEDVINTEKNPTEKAKLSKDLDLGRIGLFDGFKSVEIARIQYRANMDRIFSCAVIASRIEKTEKVQSLISDAGSSDIKDKLKKDIEKMKKLKAGNCGENADGDTLTDYGAAVSSSATVEYCSYRNYLDYLQSNIDANYTRVIELEKKIGTWDSRRNLNTLSSVAGDISNRQLQVQRDIARAASTLPKAILAYREMERTYSVHLMLMIIYDDYLELRQNVNTYLNAVSQLFEKANNAQSANNH